MIAVAEASSATLTWILRILGFVLMAVGIFLIFNPLVVLADVLSFLGNLTGVLLVVFAMMSSCVLSLVTIAVAWIAYRPIVAIPILVVAGIGLVGLITLMVRNKKPT